MSASRFIRYPIETDPTTLAQEVYDYIQARAPQWVPNDLSLDVWLIQAFTAIMAENRDLASDVPTDIFRWFGATMIGLPPIDATNSTLLSTWTAIDNQGHTIPSGTQVGILDTAGNLIPFETVADVIIPAGSTVANNVSLRSLDTGLATAGLSTIGGTIQLIDVLDFVSSVVAVAPSSGGVDAETDDDYLDRLSTHLRLLSTRPILPEDFAAIAREVAGVYRAVAIDGYDVSSGNFNNSRTVAVALLDQLGANVSPAVKNTVQAILSANREVNFVVGVMDPNRTLIDVAYTAFALPGFDPVTVKAAIDANLAAYMNAATWGTAATGNSRSWDDQRIVRYSAVGAIIKDTDGVDYWSSLTLGIHLQPLAAADVLIAGPAALAVFNASTGTVT